MLEDIKRRFFVVIHTVTNGLNHALETAELVKEAGVEGVFLIPDYAKGAGIAAVGEQFSYLEKLKVKIPELLIGVNFLVGPEILIPRIYEAQPDLYQTDSSSVLGIDKLKLPNTEFFVGVAFKYSKNVNLTGDALKSHCEMVSAIADVPTTSGDATGIEADLKKIREIRSYLPENKRLGIASGVTEHNINSYLQEGVTDFLVATSLIDRVSEENGADILNFAKVLKMSEIIHSF